MSGICPFYDDYKEEIDDLTKKLQKLREEVIIVARALDQAHYWSNVFKAAEVLRKWAGDETDGQGD